MILELRVLVKRPRKPGEGSRAPGGQPGLEAEPRAPRAPVAAEGDKRTCSLGSSPGCAVLGAASETRETAALTQGLQGCWRIRGRVTKSTAASMNAHVRVTPRFSS